MGGHNVGVVSQSTDKRAFHRAISQSGYTTSVTPSQALNQFDVDPLIKRVRQIVNQMLDQPQENLPLSEVRKRLLEIDARDFDSSTTAILSALTLTRYPLLQMTVSLYLRRGC